MLEANNNWIAHSCAVCLGLVKMPPDTNAIFYSITAINRAIHYIPHMLVTALTLGKSEWTDTTL